MRVAICSILEPELSVLDNDQTDRETRYAVTLLSNGNIRVFYLLGYYYDMGNVGAPKTECEDLYVIRPIWDLVSALFDLESCRGHIGDSEWIAEDIHYNFQTEHWVLAQVHMSAHDGANSVFTPQNGEYPTGIGYVNKAGGAPLVWVSDGKHANYASQSACNAPINDTCYSGRHIEGITLYYDGTDDNIGSADHPFIDCVGSVNPNHPGYAAGVGTRNECYWTVRDFHGWYGDGIGAGTSTAYSYHLANYLTKTSW